MEISDSLLERVEKKTNVNKDALLNIASNLNDGNMKDPDTLSKVIQDVASLVNKNVSKEMEDKIINLIINDKVPKNVDKMF